jgi:hypothetical protein
MEERVVDHFCELRKGNGNSVGGHFKSQDDGISEELELSSRPISTKLICDVSSLWQVVVIYLEGLVPEFIPALLLWAFTILTFKGQTHG